VPSPQFEVRKRGRVKVAWDVWLPTKEYGDTFWATCPTETLAEQVRDALQAVLDSKMETQGA
jgi:hypothetical protein